MIVMNAKPDARLLIFFSSFKEKNLFWSWIRVFRQCWFWRVLSKSLLRIILRNFYLCSLFIKKL